MRVSGFRSRHHGRRGIGTVLATIVFVFIVIFMTANLIVWGIVQSAGLQSVINQMTQRDQQQSSEKIGLPGALFGGTNKYTNCVVGSGGSCTNAVVPSSGGAATTPLISNQNFSSGTAGWVFTKILAPGTSSGITGGFDAGGTEVGAVGSPSGPGLIYMGVSFFPPSGTATYSATWSNKFYVDLTQYGITAGKSFQNYAPCSGPSCAVVGSWAWILPRVNPGVIALTTKFEIADSSATGTSCSPPHCYPLDQQTYTTLADQTWNYRKVTWGSLSTTGTAVAPFSASSISVAGSPWGASQWNNYFVTITSGTGSGQSRQVTATTTNNTLAVSPNWTTTPDATSQFVVSLSDSGLSTTSCAAPCTTLTDSAQNWATTQNGGKGQWAGYYVSITAGTGTGQTAVVTSNTASVLTLSSAWSTPPDTTSQYVIGCPSNNFCDWDVRSNTLLNEVPTTYTAAFWGTAGSPGFYTVQVEADFTLSQSTNPAEVRIIYDDVGLEFKTPSNSASSGGGSAAGTVVDIPLTNGENPALIQQLAVSTATSFSVANVQEASYLKDYATGIFDNLASGFVSQATVNTTNTFTGADVTKYIGTLTAQGLLSQPTGAVFDASGNLWVCDQHNNRILEYTAASLASNGPNAAIVIGQTSYSTSASATTASGLNGPTGIAFDSSGNLWVADSGNNRVLEFLKGGGFSTGQSASLVIGQATFTSSSSATSQTGLTNPAHIDFDSAGNLWVTDQGNNRILEFCKAVSGACTTSFANGEAAGLVLGESTFQASSSTPDSDPVTSGTATSISDTARTWANGQWVGGTLTITSSLGAQQSRTVVSDTGGTININPSTPFSPVPDNTYTYQVTAATTNSLNLNAPNRVRFDPSNNLWVTDSGNNRLVEFPSLSGTSSCVGSCGFTVSVSPSPGWAANQWANYLVTITGGTGAGSYGFVTGSAANTFTVASWQGAGVAPAAASTFVLTPFTGVGALLVLGQSGFTTSGSSTTATGLSGPTGMDFDSSGNMWVADTGNNRVLEYAKAFSSGEAATVAIGQSSLTANTGATSVSGLNSPAGVRFDASHNLWVTDKTNYRILEYVPGTSPCAANTLCTGMPASHEVGQPAGSAAFTTAAHPNVEILFTANSPNTFSVNSMVASVTDFYKNPNSITVQLSNGWSSTSHIADVFVIDATGSHCFTRLPAACASSLLPSSGTTVTTSTATASGLTLTDNSGNQGTWTTNSWVNSPALNYNFVYILSGTGAGSYGTISANTVNTVTVSSWTGTAPSGTVTYFIGQTWSGLYVAPGSTGVITLPYTWATGPVSIRVTTDLGNTVVLNTVAS